MSKEINLNKSALWFGYCGLIPFLLPSILIWVIGTGVPIDPLYLFFCTYSLLIGCFLTGTAAEVTPVSCIADNQFKVCETIIGLNESYQVLVRKKKAA